MSEEHVEADELLSRDEIATLFRTFASAFEADLPVAIDRPDREEFVAFDPPERASVELELETEGRSDGDEADGDGAFDSIELEIELEWPTNDRDSGSLRDGEAGDDTDDTVAVRHVTDADALEETAVVVPTMAEGTASMADSESVTADETKRRSQFEVYRDRAGEYRWRLVHWNGNIIADSGEGYTSRASAVNGLQSVVANAPSARIDHRE